MLTSGLPATFAEAEEREIIAALEQWYSHIAVRLISEAAHEVMRDEFYQLERGNGASAPRASIVAMIVDMADAGHPAADHALRVYIHAAIDADRFNDLPVQIRAYAQRALRRPPLPPGYPSNRPQVANSFIRDLSIGWLIDEVVRCWPQVPQFYSSQTRHSAAWLLALVFTRNGIKLAEQQVRRIYKGRQTIHRRLAEFLFPRVAAGQPME
jgi:hypothetical protein